MRYTISLGSTSPGVGEGFGEWDGETPEAALLACLRDQDPREYNVTQLSNSAGFGQGQAGRTDGHGNGTADRSGWWYVASAQGLTIFEAVDAESGA